MHGIIRFRVTPTRTERELDARSSVFGSGYATESRRGIQLAVERRNVPDRAFALKHDEKPIVHVHPAARFLDHIEHSAQQTLLVMSDERYFTGI